MSKKWIASNLIALTALAGWLAAQSPSSLFDARKAEKELQVMEGILQTTLKFVTTEISVEEAVLAYSVSPKGLLRLGGSSVNGFYLYDQGAVFVVDLPGIRIARGVAAGRVYSALAGEYLRVAPKAADRDRSRGSGSSRGTRERLMELQERVKQEQEELKEEAEKHRQRLDEVKGYLVEALANHGDSLTVLGDDEYINLVLNSPSDSWLLTSFSTARIGGGKDRPEYISVKKSWIGDYKAGRLTLDQFKKKVLSY
ncbi:MAG: hypothetical protein V3T83_14005 [Acidobacteriota bacterium]